MISITRKILRLWKDEGFMQVIWTIYSRFTYLPFYRNFLKKTTPIIIKLTPSFISLLMDAGLKIRRLPLPWERIVKESSVFSDFCIEKKGSINFSEVNIIFRGDVGKNLCINKNLPTIFINPKNEIPSDYKNVWLGTSDRNVFAVMNQDKDLAYGEQFQVKKHQQKLIFFASNMRHKEPWNTKKISKNEKLRVEKLLGQNLNINEIFYVKTRFGLKNIQIGSGILAVLCLLKTCQKVNVYGWDAFIGDSFGESFQEQTANLWNTESWVNDYTRFSAIVFNWIYANRLYEEFKDSKKLQISGRVTETFDKPWIKKYLFSVIYKN